MVRSASHGIPAISVIRMPSTHQVVARIATMAAAPKQRRVRIADHAHRQARRPAASHFAAGKSRCVTKIISHANSPPNSETPNR